MGVASAADNITWPGFLSGDVFHFFVKYQCLLSQSLSNRTVIMYSHFLQEFKLVLSKIKQISISGRKR